MIDESRNQLIRDGLIDGVGESWKQFYFQELRKIVTVQLLLQLVDITYITIGE